MRGHPEPEREAFERTDGESGTIGRKEGAGPLSFFIQLRWYPPRRMLTPPCLGPCAVSSLSSEIWSVRMLDRFVPVSTLHSNVMLDRDLGILYARAGCSQKTQSVLVSTFDFPTRKEIPPSSLARVECFPERR